MNYSYDAQGGVSVFGTADVKVEYVYYTKYAVGATVYSRYAAEHKGRLEALVVKKYKILFAQNDVLYTDTLNALWNEGQLCTKAAAATLAIAYHERLAEQAEAWLGLGS